MIPKFPKFKKICLGDRSIIGSYLDNRRPYSTFNFTNLWAWNIRAERMVSDLYGNLVVLFAEYETSKPFYSFYGTNEPEGTARELLNFSEMNGGPPVLRFITEETVRTLNTPSLCIEKDRDNFDYIFSTSKIAQSNGRAYKSKRMWAKTFVREHPHAAFELRDLTNPDTQEQLAAVVKRWEQNKKLHGKAYNLKHEKIALDRLLATAGDHDLVLSCVTLQDKIIAFSIDEILQNKHAMAHFIKADISFRGVFEFINEKVAQYLVDRDVEFWNWQQDLSIEGLRGLKTSYRPIHFLEKFKVSLSSHIR